MELNTQCVFPKDAQRLIGKTIWTARRLLHRIRVEVGKKPKQFVTAEEFAIHTGIPLGTVLRTINDNQAVRPVIDQKNGHNDASINSGQNAKAGPDSKSRYIESNNNDQKPIEIAITSFRQVLDTACEFCNDALNPRLTRVFTRMIEKAEGIPGKRPLLISKNKKELIHFELNVKSSFLAAFAAHPKASHNELRTKASVDLRDIRIWDTQQFSRLKTVTHFKLFHVIGTLSDVVYDPVQGTYRFLDEPLNALSSTTESDFISLTSEDSLSLSLESSLPENITPTESTTVIQALGLAYYEIRGHHTTLFRKGKAMQIIDVF